uniref:KIB1-4 beta-propeller domain-containing protein n=1 Tax=Oryza glumipatula TaxID=40148 RepID=A0A0D9Y9T0_9ORYZ
MAPPLVSWSDGLPPEILLIVLAHLHCLADRVSFAAACRNWRSTSKLADTEADKPAPASAPRRQHVPWLLAPSPVERPTITSLLSGLTRRISLPARLRGARFFGSDPGGWLAAVLTMCGTSSPTSTPARRVVSQVTCTRKTTTVAIIRAVALSAAPSSAGCLAAAFVCGTSNLAFTQRLDGDGGGRFHALTTCELMTVFAISPSPESDLLDGRVEICHRSFFMPMRIETVLPHLRESADMSRYLVVSRNKLLMVVRYYVTAAAAAAAAVGVSHARTMLFKVFQMEKFCSHGGFWEEIEDLDGRVLFLARCCSRAFEASEIHGFEGGSIYFLDDINFHLSLVIKDKADYPCADVGMYAISPTDGVARPGMQLAAGIRPSIYSTKHYLLRIMNCKGIARIYRYVLKGPVLCHHQLVRTRLVLVMVQVLLLLIRERMREASWELSGASGLHRFQSSLLHCGWSHSFSIWIESAGALLGLEVE